MNIPTRDKCLELLKEYNLSEKKIDHSILVADVALFLAKKLIEKGEKIDLKVLEAGALLHDIARTISKDKGSDHAKEGEETARNMGFERLMPIIRKHSLTGILDYKLDSWEEKLVYYVDQRVGNSIMSVDERTRPWPDSHPAIKDKMLKSIIKAKELEKYIFSKLDFKPEDLEKELKK